MELEGNFISTDIRYRGKNAVKKGQTKLQTKKKVSITVGGEENVEKGYSVVEGGVQYCGDEKVDDVVGKSADNGDTNNSVVKGEKEKEEDLREISEECCGGAGKVVKGEKEKEKKDCGAVSKQILSSVRKHLGSGRGECCCGVVVNNVVV